MGQHEKPLASKTFEADRDVITGLRGVAEYAPRNPRHATTSLETLEAAARSDEQALLDAERLMVEARRRLTSSSWEFHEAVQGAKAEVIAQFGDDSTVLRAIGLTPRSERKRPMRRKAAG